MGCREFWMVHSQEHFAWLLCYSWSALISAFSLSVTSPGTLEIAKAAQDKDGNIAFGLKWSNAIATMATVGSLTLVVLAPIRELGRLYTPPKIIWDHICLLSGRLLHPVVLPLRRNTGCSDSSRYLFACCVPIRIPIFAGAILA